MERNMTLADILIVLVRNLKNIIIFTIIGSILAGGYTAYSKIVSDPLAGPSVNFYASSMQIAKNRVKALEEDSRVEKLVTIDLSKVPTVLVTFYISNGYQLHTDKTLQEENPIEDIVAAYNAFSLLKAMPVEISEQLVTQLGISKKEQQFLWFSSIEKINDSNILVLEVIWDDLEEAEKIAKILIDSLYKNINAKVSEHTLTVVETTPVLKESNVLVQYQENYQTAYTIAQKSILDIESQYGNNEVTLKSTIKSSVVYGIVGAVGFFIIACVLFLVFDLVNPRTTEKAYSFQKNQIPKWGNAHQYPKVIGKVIAFLLGKKHGDFNLEKEYDLISFYIKDYVQKNGQGSNLVFIGNVAETEMIDLYKNLIAYDNELKGMMTLPRVCKKRNYSISQSLPEISEALGKNSCAVWVEKINGSFESQIEEDIESAGGLDIKFAGYVLI